MRVDKSCNCRGKRDWRARLEMGFLVYVAGKESAAVGEGRCHKAWHISGSFQARVSEPCGVPVWWGH